jgi:hypothetical protein
VVWFLSGARRFSSLKRPDRFEYLPSLLFNGHQGLFPPAKSGRQWFRGGSSYNLNIIDLCSLVLSFSRRHTKTEDFKLNVYNILALWDVTPCTDISKELAPPSCTMMMEVTSSSEILAHIGQTTRRHVPENSHLHSHRSENRNSC